MKWRIEFERRHTAQKAGEIGRMFAVEVTAKNEAEAREIANRDAARTGRSAPFQIKTVRKI